MTSNDLPGKFRVNKNKNKEDGDNRPFFTGKMTMPGDHSPRALSLWTHVSERSGKSVLSGKLSLSAMEQINAFTPNAPQLPTSEAIELAAKNGAEALKIEAGDVLMFINTSKKDNPDRPDYFGYANPGKGQQLVRISGWLDVDRAGNATLSGTANWQDMQRSAEKEDHPSPFKEDLTVDERDDAERENDEIEDERAA